MIKRRHEKKNNIEIKRTRTHRTLFIFIILINNILKGKLLIVIIADETYILYISIMYSLIPSREKKKKTIYGHTFIIIKLIKVLQYY